MKSKKIRVRLRARGISLIDDEPVRGGSSADDTIEYVTDGVLSDTGGTIELSYDESAEMGFLDTRTTLLFDKRQPLRINLTRSGVNTAGLAFDPEVKRQACALNVEGAGLEFCVCTRRVSNTLTMDGGSIGLDYILEYHGCKTERTIINIDVEELKSGEVRS